MDASTDGSSGPAVSARGVKKTFGSGNSAVPALKGVDLDAKCGEMLMIDNTRFLHGRRSNDDQRRVYVRMGNAAF